MIQQLGIKNFKSIVDIKIDCKKLNIFIGEPNSGKSNILEALSFQSQNAIWPELNKNIFRYKTIGSLFHDFDINSPIEVSTDKRTTLSYAVRENGVPENDFDFLLNADSNELDNNPIKIQHDGKVRNNGNIGTTNLRLYEYKRLSSFQHGNLSHLAAPNGENLPDLLLANKELKNWVADFLKSKELTLTLKPTENDIEVSKLIDSTIYSYPYFSISETLQRVIFYEIAIKSNKDAVLLFDEPETNTFPFYTKYIAERIALDENNQFFITTHNPYLLLSLIEKSNIENLNVCLVRMVNYQTEVISLNENQISQVLDFNSDVFFNFDQLVAE